MSEFDPKLNHTPQEEEKAPYVPASFEKRTAAWMGIAYMLLIMFAVTFSIFTGGRTLPGTFPLFLIPVSVAALVVTVYRQVKGQARGGLPVTVLVVLVCLAAVVLGLLMGIPALVDGVRGAAL